MNDRSRPETFLLVHGLWHGSWVWDEVVQRLHAAGHDAIVMNLPGRAGDPTAAETITLETHANAIGAVIRLAAAERARSVIVVAHSTTGVYVTQAAEQCSELVKKLVYVSAFVPKNGQSAGQLQAMGGQHGGQVGQYVVREPPYVFLKRDMPTDIFYGDVAPAVAARAKAMLVAEPMRPLADPVSITSARFGSIPRDYVGFQDDKAITPAFQRVMYMATPCKVIEMSGGHSHWLADPGAFARVLAEGFGGDVNVAPPPAPLGAFR